jgi:hypothetical protein
MEHRDALRGLLRRVLLLSLGTPLCVSCTTRTEEPPLAGDPPVATGSGAAADAAPDASQDAAKPPSTSDAALDAPDDAADAGTPGCTVVEHGFPGGAGCKPTILACAPAVPNPDCKSVCPPNEADSCYAEEGGATIRCYFGCGGRRPAGYLPSTSASLASTGAFFANMAELEAASVDAFETLRDELVIHGAPGELVRAAKEAAADEIRHAKITAALARRYGSEPSVREIARHPPRELEELATDNVAEGCVRETFGALVAMHQAERAEDPAVRSAMTRIAEEETRHAALSWQLASWLAARLDDATRARVERAMDEAIRELGGAISIEPPDEVRRRAGLPTARRATQMLDGLRAALWS